MSTATLHPKRLTLEGSPWSDVTVGEVMHPGVIVCSPEAPVRHAAWLMSTHRIHAVIALGDDEAGGLWGVVTDSDVLDAAATDELDKLTVGAVAQTQVVTISRSDSLARARGRMHEHGVTHLLVTARDRPVGIVSTLDLIDAAAAGVGATRRH
jgi:CBS domain-containing protein